MRTTSAPFRISRATVLTGFAGLVIVAAGAGIAAATGEGGPTTGTDAGYGVVVADTSDAPVGATATGTDCPWSDGTPGRGAAGDPADTTDATLVDAR